MAFVDLPNQARGDCFNPYKALFNQHTLLVPHIRSNPCAISIYTPSSKSLCKKTFFYIVSNQSVQQEIVIFECNSFLRLEQKFSHNQCRMPEYILCDQSSFIIIKGAICLVYHNIDAPATNTLLTYLSLNNFLTPIFSSAFISSSIAGT